MRYLMTVSYDGSKYYGFQRLNNEKSVQAELEKALSKVNKSEVLIKGAGRTDRGVHAKRQCCHFDLNVDIPPKRLINAVNSLLDNYIRVVDCKYVDEKFHARFAVKEKTYRYTINMGEFDPIREDYLYNYGYKLNIKDMKKASRYLIGKHSYKAFVSGSRKNYNSQIFDIKINKKNNKLYISFVGTSFYRYMVRNLVGALISVCEEKIDLNELKLMLESGDIVKNYLTVPSNGLYLDYIEY